MRLRENIKIALSALNANKLRASLTMLGIMIGVGAVITLTAIGDGVTRFVADQFIGLGTNLIFVIPSDDPNNDFQPLTMTDVEALRDPARVPNVAALAPIVQRSNEVIYNGNRYEPRIISSTPDYATVRGYTIQRGRFLSEVDYNGRSRVAVLGADVVEALYPPDVDPLDTDIKIRGINFRVVGLFESKGAGTFGSQDDLIVVPLTTAQERLYNLRNPTNGRLRIDFILVQAVGSQAIDDLIVDAADVLRQSHNINFRDEDDFLLLTQQDFLSSFGEVTAVLTLFLGAIASISLLVGGIGIMNIMLVSVTERTREIGLRKAVGAKRRDILWQFLGEAMILSVLGGTVGVVLGAVGAALVQYFVPELDTTITIESVVLAVGFSAGVGLFFGIYPASRAASLNPIDALRFE